MNMVFHFFDDVSQILSLSSDDLSIIAQIGMKIMAIASSISPQNQRMLKNTV